MMSSNVYAAVQNGVILDTFESYNEALDRIKSEQQNDLLVVMFTKKLRKIFKKSGNVPLHNYSVIHITEVAEIK